MKSILEGAAIGLVLFLGILFAAPPVAYALKLWSHYWQ